MTPILAVSQNRETNFRHIYPLLFQPLRTREQAPSLRRREKSPGPSCIKGG